MGFYNSLTNSIIAYELNYDRTFVGDIDIDRMRCDVKDKGSVNLQMHHHCAEYLPAQDKLILFGGYGNRIFKYRLAPESEVLENRQYVHVF